MGMIVTLTGRSCAGKSAIAAGIYKKLRLARPVMSVTTRSARPGEVGNPHCEYVFVDPAAMGRHGPFLWEERWKGGNLYATPRSAVAQVLDEPEAIGLMVLVPRVLPILEHFIEAHTCNLSRTFLPLYVFAREEDLLRRECERGGDPNSAASKERRENEKTWDLAARTHHPADFKFIFNTGHIDEAILRAMSHIHRFLEAAS